MDFEKIIIAEAKKHNIPGLDWEDIAQEVRIRLWTKRHLFNPDKSSYKTWANRVMSNCIRNLIRASKSKKAAFLNEAISLEKFIEDEKCIL
jgi:RNA polymerase sigma factor (sigma-70 family)